jgi:hypothetical protein
MDADRQLEWFSQLRSGWCRVRRLRATMSAVVLASAVVLSLNPAAIVLAGHVSQPSSARAGAGERTAMLVSRASRIVGVTSTAVSHGLKITLFVGQPSYPTDSLAQTTITVANVSSKPIGVINSPCTGQFTHAEVINSKGVPYPWPLPTYPVPCPLVLPAPLAPGASITDDSIVYMESGRLRAAVTIQTASPGSEYVNITGTTLTVKLYSSPPEHATFAAQPGSGGGFTTSIWPVPKDAGRLYYADVQICRGAQEQDIEGGMAGVWQSTSGSTLSTDILGPSCRHEEWHLIAGWLDYPAAHLDFSATTS